IDFRKLLVVTRRFIVRTLGGTVAARQALIAMPSEILFARVKLALLQMRLEPGAAERNLSRAAELLREAKEKGTDLALLPEALPFGWMDPSAREFAEAIPGGRHYEELSLLAARHGIHLCSGLI